MEVEFLVGPRKQRRGASASDSGGGGEEQLSAFQVKVLDPGSIEWEVEEEPKGIKRIGKIERMLRMNHHRHRDRDRDRNRDRNRDRDGGASEGTIRLQPMEEKDQETNNDASEKGGSESNAATSPKKDVKKETLVKFTAEDYAVYMGSGSNNFRSKNDALGRNDLVEFTMVKEKRTGMKYARNIVLLQSERKRLEEERELVMLQNAILEQGVVVSLDNEFGYLRSNKRKEEVYFHFSQMLLPEDEDNFDNMDGEDQEEGDMNQKIEKNVSTFVLKEGQEVEFLVVVEANFDRGGKDKLAARKVTFLPKGTVEFEQVVAKGVKGVLSLAPRLFNSMNAGRRGRKSVTKMLEEPGKVQLCEPIRWSPSGQMQLEGENKGEKEEDCFVEISEAILDPNDCRGLLKDERDQKAELWIKVGDTLIFDVIRVVMDGSYRVAPTKHTDGESNESSKIRLVAPGLVGRAEGIVASIRQDFGFVQLAHRNVDVYFRLSEIMPPLMQQEMTPSANSEDAKKFEIVVGSEVTFDLSLMPPKVRSGKHNGRYGNRGSERDQLRAQRLVVLPAGSLVINKVELDVSGVVERMKGGYSGQVRLNKKFNGISQSSQYPLMVKLICDFAGDTSEKVLNFQDIQSEEENDIIANIVRSHSGLELQFVPDPDFGGGNRGMICIQKVERESKDGSGVETESIPVSTHNASGIESEDVLDKSVDAEDDVNADEDAGNENEEDVGAASHSPSKKRSRKKTKSIKMIAFERQSLSHALTAEPPMNGDKVSMTIKYSRSSGQFTVSDMVLVERNEIISKAVQYNMCEGYVLLEPVHTSFKESKSKRRGFEGGGWGSDEKVDIDGSSNGDGIILLLDDPAGLYKPKKETPLLGSDASDEGGDNSNLENVAHDVAALTIEKDEGTHLGQHIHYTIASIAGRASDTPKRGDIVSFTKGKNSKAKDTRIVSKAFAQRVKGRLTKLDLEKETAEFQSLTDSRTYDVNLSEVVSCETRVLKEGTAVEGVLHDGFIVGICRNSDLYLESTIAGGKKERPKLNLNVKVGLGGKIIAQSCMAKGPDGTLGFNLGWTTRISKYAVPPQVSQLENSLNKDATPFVYDLPSTEDTNVLVGDGDKEVADTA